REEEERKRRAKEALAARAAQTAAAPAETDDVPIREEDLDLEEVRRDEQMLSEAARRAAREGIAPAPPAAPKRRRKLGKPLALGAFVLLVVAVGVLHVMPMSTAQYEAAASEALGVPVRIGEARLSLLTGVSLNMARVSIGEATVAAVRARPAVGALFDARKTFEWIELEGVAAGQGAFGAALFGKASGANFGVARVVAKQVKLEGPLALPTLEIEAAFGADGAPRSVTLRGPEKLEVRFSPRGAEAGFELSAGSLAVPFVPALGLTEVSAKGLATREALSVSQFDGRAFDGVISGSAAIRWGAVWSVEGELRVRNVNAAVFAPALVSEGRAEGRGTFRMSGPQPARLHESARLEGSFRIEKGALGFDIGRALSTGQTGGRTEFAELTAQGVYDRGAVQVRNIAFSRGAMSATGALEISADGALAGRLSAEVKTPTQVLRGALSLAGRAGDPVIRK
ncbi:MAG: hypothetical protein N2653_10960, partial [Burkholderiales bacterium]|nr:hypothetical protein [Burkholderiales bacterium]